MAGRAELLDSSAGGTGWSCAGWDSGKAPWGTEQMVLGAAQALTRQWFFLQRAVLRMGSASEGFFFIRMGPENICNHFYSTCIYGRLFFCKGTS